MAVYSHASGLCNVLATFEQVMERVLQQLISKICLVYLNDVIVFGKTFEELVENFETVSLRFRTANLKLNPKKCNLFERQAKYLGYITSAEGISQNPEKTAAVADPSE